MPERAKARISNFFDGGPPDPRFPGRGKEGVRGEERIGRGSTSLFIIGSLGPCPPLTCEKILHMAKTVKYCVQMYKKLQLLRDFAPYPLPELGPWSILGDFRSPRSSGCIKWQCGDLAFGPMYVTEPYRHPRAELYENITADERQNSCHCCFQRIKEERDATDDS